MKGEIIPHCLELIKYTKNIAWQYVQVEKVVVLGFYLTNLNRGVYFLL